MVPAPESLQIIEAKLKSTWPLLLNNDEFEHGSSRIKLGILINVTKKNSSSSTSYIECFRVQNNDGEEKGMNSSRDDLLTTLNGEMYLQKRVKNKDESVNFDESGIIAVASHLCGKGEMARAFFFLILFNKVMINHAIMSSINQLRSIFPQFLAYVHSL